MTRNLTSEDINELVSPKSMSHVAKELGMSDVMVGKLCKEKRRLNHRMRISIES